MTRLFILLISIFTFFTFQGRGQVSVKIETGKDVYHIGDTIKLQVIKK